MSDKGHIELQRQIDSIIVGVRHRRDLGDMSALMRSIEEVGLLQPITVTPDGVLEFLTEVKPLRRLLCWCWRAGMLERSATSVTPGPSPACGAGSCGVRRRLLGVCGRPCAAP